MGFLWDSLRQAIELIVSLDADVFRPTFRSVWISSLAIAAASLVGIPIGMVLARKSFAGRHLVVTLFRAGMAMPTVFIGIVCYGLLSRQGPLGPLQVLYTPWAISLGEFFLALPIVVSITHGSVCALDPRVGETALSLGAGRLFRARTYLSEARIGISLAIMTAFARCITELGIAMMVGGNLKGRTRTLATATAMETGKGEFAHGLATALILLILALCVLVIIGHLTRDTRKTAR